MAIDDIHPNSRYGLDAHALAAIAAVTGDWPVQPDWRTKTFVTPTGTTVHLRTYAGRSPDWFFGIMDRFWVPEEFFVFVCDGGPTMFCVPVRDLPKRWVFPVDYNGNRKLHIVKRRGRWVLRDPYPVFDLDPYLDAFHLLA